MQKNKLVIIGWLVLSLVIAICYFFSDPKLELVANSIVNVYEDVDKAIGIPPQKSFAKLMPHDRVHVIKNVDVKHYVVYKVQLSDGRIGFVNDGDYTLL